MRDFYQLFKLGVQEMYAVEKQIIEALPELVRAASEPTLKAALRHHLEETKIQAARLEKIANDLKIDFGFDQPIFMHLLLQKGHKCTKMHCPPEVQDAAIIAAAQCVEHHEMALYGTLKAFACVLELNSIEKILNESLQEEVKADKKLGEIAKGTLFTKGINKQTHEKVCS